MDRSFDEGRNTDEFVSGDVMMGEVQDNWVTRARVAYGAAVASAVDAVAHYHQAALEILGAQEAYRRGNRKPLSQQDIGELMGISQPAVSKLLAWERKYGAQLIAGGSVPVPSPYYQPPPATPEQAAEKKNKRAATASVAAEVQRQYEIVQRDYEGQVRALAAENKAKDARIAQLETDIPLASETGSADDEIEQAIWNLLAKLPTSEDRLEVLGRLEARLLAEQGASS